MKNYRPLLVLVAIVALLATAFSYRSNNSYGLVEGTPDIKSISALTFGPNGILFIGDSRNAAIVAIDTKDATEAPAQSIDLKGFDKMVASALGTTVDNVSIQDVAVNPISKKVYCAVHTGDGIPALLRIAGDKIEAVSLKDASYSSVALNDAPAEDAKDERGRSLRIASISDIQFSNGKVMVSGLSNKEFSSSFRAISFPFNDKQQSSSLEIYHAAHGRYETTSPIRTFTTATIGGKDYLIASYTCTPLVLFPLDELKPGQHVKGRTVAEMGSGNQPLDMITMSKDGNSFLIMANSNRPVFRVNFKSIEAFQGSLTKPVEENFATEGVSFVSMPLTNVFQLDKMDDRMVLLQRRSNGSLDMWTTEKAKWYLE